MKSGKIQLLDLDFEYKLWKNKITHYRTELEIIQARILVILKEFDEFEIEEEYETLLTVQLESLKNTEKKISTQENEMACYASDYPINESHTHYVNHESIRSEMKKIYLRQVEINESIVHLLCYPIIYFDTY